MLLDQANLSGVGNWVADEVLYQARIHPEQYCNTFDDKQIKKLHDALISVCTTAVETLADTEQFPDDWIMKYRWDKGKKDGNVLPNGEKIVHLKVGGRTSAIVPTLQKKTGPVAADVDSDDQSDDVQKPAKGRKRKPKTNDEDEDAKPAKKVRGKKGAQVNGVKEEDEEPQMNGTSEEVAEKPSKAARGKKATPNKTGKAAPTSGSRRSIRTKA